VSLFGLSTDLGLSTSKTSIYKNYCNNGHNS
jgi:hypothetical protein